MLASSSSELWWSFPFVVETQKLALGTLLWRPRSWRWGPIDPLELFSRHISPPGLLIKKGKNPGKIRKKNPGQCVFRELSWAPRLSFLAMSTHRWVSVCFSLSLTVESHFKCLTTDFSTINPPFLQTSLSVCRLSAAWGPTLNTHLSFYNMSSTLIWLFTKELY